MKLKEYLDQAAIENSKLEEKDVKLAELAATKECLLHLSKQFEDVLPISKFLNNCAEKEIGGQMRVQSVEGKYYFIGVVFLSNDGYLGTITVDNVGKAKELIPINNDCLVVMHEPDLFLTIRNKVHVALEDKEVKFRKICIALNATQFEKISSTLKKEEDIDINENMSIQYNNIEYSFIVTNGAKGLIRIFEIN